MKNTLHKEKEPGLTSSVLERKYLNKEQFEALPFSATAMLDEEFRRQVKSGQLSFDLVEQNESDIPLAQQQFMAGMHDQNTRSIAYDASDEIAKHLTQGDKSAASNIADALNQGDSEVEDLEIQKLVINRSAARFATVLDQMLNQQYTNGKKIDAFLKFKDNLTAQNRQKLVAGLETVIKNAEFHLARLKK